MDREKKVFLCVKSLLNISKDIVEVYKDYSDILLFIADKIAEKEQKRSKEDETYTIHGEGQVHDLKTPRDLALGPVNVDKNKCTCGEGEACSECEFVLEEDQIEKEIDDMILTVKKEMESVSD